MASKDKTASPTSQTTTSATEETIALLPSDGGLAGSTTSATSEAGKRVDVVQKAQVSPEPVKVKPRGSSPVKEKSSPQKTVP